MNAELRRVREYNKTHRDTYMTRDGEIWEYRKYQKAPVLTIIVPALLILSGIIFFLLKN